MSKFATFLACALIAAAALAAIVLMFRPEPPAPAGHAKPPSPDHTLSADEPSIASPAPALPPALSPEKLPASATSFPATAPAPRALAGKPGQPLHAIAALSAADRAARDRATQALIDQGANPDAREKLFEELHAAFDSATSTGKLRIQYVATHIKGSVRTVDDPRAPAALLAGLHYLESHLSDPQIADFAPQESLTHLSVSRGDGGQLVWLLDDIHSSRGINLYFDPAGRQVIKVTTWPQPAPPR